jgi:hypothetical protein
VNFNKGMPLGQEIRKIGVDLQLENFLRGVKKSQGVYELQQKEQGDE